MSIGALDAINAYGRTLTSLPGVERLGPAEEAVAPVTTTATAPGTFVAGSFGNIVQTMVGDTAATLRTAEAESAKQVAGKGDLIDVVTAVGAAESALNTIVAVRDRMVNAYSEIMRMQI